jgi:hypothetical protein
LQYYCSGAEVLRVTIYSLISNWRALTLSGRTWDLASGRRDPFFEVVHDHDQLPARGTVFNYTLPAGALLNVRIGVTNNAVSPGMVFVRLQLVLGRGATGVVLSTLAQGYVSLTSDVAWPGSPVTSAGDGPGFLTNVGWGSATGPLRGQTTVPTGFKYEVVAANASFVASALAGNRSLHTQLIDSGGTNMFTGSGADVIGPGSGVSVNLLPGMGPTQINVASVVHLPWPSGLALREGLVIRLFVNNEQAGDALTLNGLLVRRFLDL